MNTIDFNGVITYEPNSIIDFDKDYTINLSSMLFTLHPNFIKSPVALKTFDLQDAFEIQLALMIKYKDNKPRKLFVQPDFQTLGKAFGFKINDYVYSSDLSKNENIASKYQAEFKELMKEINNFINTRNNLFAGKENSISPYDEKTNKEISDMIGILNKILFDVSLDVVDYRFNCFDIVKSSYRRHLPAIHNYKTLRSFIKNFVIQKNEFYIPEEMIEEYEFLKATAESAIHSADTQSEYEEYEKTIDDCNVVLSSVEEEIGKLNSISSFNKEKLSVLYVLLEDLEKKEEALNLFIYKILNNLIKTEILIEDDF